MGQMAAMLEPSPVIGLYTAPPTVLVSALPSRLQTVPDVHLQIVRDQLFGAMNQISRTETKRTEQGGALAALSYAGDV